MWYGLSGPDSSSPSVGPSSPQPASRSAKIGVLSIQAIDPSPEGTAFRAALRDLGYAEGQNLALTFRRAGLPQ